MNTITNQRTNTEWTSYMATSIAEGFLKTGNSAELRNSDMILESWAYIGQSGLYLFYDEWFDRQLDWYVFYGVLTEDFVPVWDEWDAFPM